MRSNTEILVEAVYYKVAAQLLQDNLDIDNFLNNLEYLKILFFTDSERQAITHQLKALNMLGESDRIKLITTDLTFLKNENYIHHFAWMLSFAKNNLNKN